MKKLLSLLSVILIAAVLVACGSDGNGNGGGYELTFDVTVYDAEEEQINSVEIQTNEENLFDALMASGEIDLGYEESDFGAFITVIDGLEAEEGYFWAFYVDGEMSMVGVTDHVIEDGQSIMFRLENW